MAYQDEETKTFLFLGEISEGIADIIDDAVYGDACPLPEFCDKWGLVPPDDPWLDEEDCYHVALLPLLLCDDPSKVFPYAHVPVYISAAGRSRSDAGDALSVELSGAWWDSPFCMDGWDEGDRNFPSALVEASDCFSDWVFDHQTS